MWEMLKKNDSGTNTLGLIPDPKQYFFQDKFYEIQFHVRLRHR